MLQIVRRLRNRSPYKAAVSQPKFPNNLDYAWQFAGWGKFVYAEQDRTLANSHPQIVISRPRGRRSGRCCTPPCSREKLSEARSIPSYLDSGQRCLGLCILFVCTLSLTSRRILIALFRLPAICATANIYSTICMAVACSVLFLFRPILLELGDAIRVDGASVSIVSPLVEMLYIFRLV